MAGFSYNFSAFQQLSRDLQKIGDQVIRNEQQAVSVGAHAYQRDVQRIAPVDTGQYRAGIRVDMMSEGMHPVAYIGSPAPQARRLEFGFMGADSLGRVYHQKPRPHWRPPWDNNMPRYRDLMLAVLAGKPYARGI